MYAEMNDITFFSLPEESYVHQILLFFTQKKKKIPSKKKRNKLMLGKVLFEKRRRRRRRRKKNSCAFVFRIFRMRIILPVSRYSLRQNEEKKILWATLQLAHKLSRFLLLKNTD
jgi:hypothetical protein